MTTMSGVVRFLAPLVLGVALIVPGRWAAIEPYRMNAHQKYVTTVVEPAVRSGRNFPDSQALQAMTRSLRDYGRRHPDDPNAAMALALTLRAQRRDDAALEVYRSLLEVQARGEVDLQIALLSQRLNPDDAARHYHAAVERDIRLSNSVPDRDTRRRIRQDLNRKRWWLSR